MRKKKKEKNPLRANKYRNVISSLGTFQGLNFWMLGEYSGGA